MQPPIVQQPFTTPPAGVMIVSGRPTSMMNPVDSVITCLQKYVGFEGRASRSEYWWFFLAIFVVSIPIGIIDGMVFGWDLKDPMWFSDIFNLVMLLPSLAVGVRRIHDHGKSGWWILLPFYNLYLFIIEGENVANVYGPVPTNTRNGNLDGTYVVVQQPMQQQYQQPVQQQYQQPMQQQYQQPVQQQNQEPPSGL